MKWINEEAAEVCYSRS